MASVQLWWAAVLFINCSLAFAKAESMGGYDMARILFGREEKPLRMLGPVAVAFFVLALIKALIVLVLPEPGKVSSSVQQALEDFGGSYLTLALVAVFIAPVLEETLFRGGLYNALRLLLRQYRFCSGVLAALIATILSAGIFAVCHPDLAWRPFFMHFGFGLTAAELYRRTGALIAPIALHSISNGFVVVMYALFH